MELSTSSVERMLLQPCSSNMNYLNVFIFTKFSIGSFHSMCFLRRKRSPSPSTESPFTKSQPWSAYRLTLLPPSTTPKRGVAPETSPSPSPFPRHGHALTATPSPKGDLFLFGGIVHESAKNDVHVFSASTNSTSLVQTTGTPPSPRKDPSCALFETAVIVWGGDTNTDPSIPPTEIDDSLHLLNLSMSLVYFIRSVFSLVFQKPRNGIYSKQLAPVRKGGMVTL